MNKIITFKDLVVLINKSKENLKNNKVKPPYYVVISNEYCFKFDLSPGMFINGVEIIPEWEYISGLKKFGDGYESKNK